MNLKKYTLLLLIPASLLVFTGCEDILDKEPTDKLSLEETFKDLDGAKTALLGSYRSLLQTDLYLHKVMAYPDLVGGNVKYGRERFFPLEDLYHFAQTAENGSMNNTYEEAYSTLNNLNNVIRYTPETLHGTQQAKNRVMAEAMALRALLHFELVRLYAQPYKFSPDAAHPGIVLNLQPRLYTDPLPKRATVAETYEAIIKDLTEAVALFDNSTAVFSGGSSKTYMSKNAAKSLLAKVYLYKGDWQQAFRQADEVINSRQYTLLTSQQYGASWASRQPSAESIFELALESNFSGTSLGSFYDLTSGELAYAATEDLLTSYSETDIRGREKLFNTKTILGSTFFFTKKYAMGGTASTPIKVLRLSELYLIRAEAAAELGNLEQAAQDLDAIRLRADAEAIPGEWTDQASLLDAILLERRKELAFEGNLYFDLRRRMLPITRTDCTAQVCSLEPTDPRLVLPLPKATTNVNPDLKQNDGY